MVSVIIAAGGKGTRMGADKNKVYLELCGMEIIARTVTAFQKNPLVNEIVVVTGENDIPVFNEIKEKYNFSKVTDVVCGGETRAKSVYNGLCRINGDIVLIHDGARALISGDEINRVIEDCRKYGAAAVGVKCKDTLKSADENGFINATIDREKTYQIQTPQAFKTKEIIAAHKSVNDALATDDCMIAEKYGIKIKITEGSYNNIKITTPSDMLLAKQIIKDY